MKDVFNKIKCLNGLWRIGCNQQYVACKYDPIDYEGKDILPKEIYKEAKKFEKLMKKQREECDEQTY